MRSAAMHIAFAANETYAVGLAAAVQSVVESLHRCNRPADIWILDFGLREQSSRWLLRIQDMLSHPQQDSSSGSNSGTAVDPAQIKLHIVAPTTQGPAGQLLSQLPPAMGYASSVTWSKLFLPDLLPSAAADNHGLLLYLDSDVIVTPGTDLRQLWDNWLKVTGCRGVAQKALCMIGACALLLSLLLQQPHVQLVGLRVTRISPSRSIVP